MVNPMLAMLNKNGLSQMQQAVNMVKSMQNPQAMIQSMMKQNPAVSKIIAEYGNDPKKAFYAMAKQKGVDPNTILSMLK